MKPKSFYTFACMLVIAALVVLLSSANGGNAQGNALGIAPGIAPSVAQKPAPADGTISYSGRLSNDDRQPVTDGMYAFTFALYDAANDGNLLWSETQTGVAVQGGAFTVVLGSVTPLPKRVRISQGWLAVGVRGPGEADFTLLAPRQLLNAALPAVFSSPATGPACAHDHFGEEWIGDPYGTPEDAGLYVEDTGPYGTAIKGEVNSEWASQGVWGVSWGGYGVYGEAGYLTGTGVVAYNHYTKGAALAIQKGAFKVMGSAWYTDTTVFIHQATAGNNCPAFTNATVINHPLTNDDSNAILIVTLNGGTLGAGVGPSNPYIFVEYDATNVCGFGHRWVIFNNLSAMPNGTKFNVLVIKS